MVRPLIIVESPAKARTISRFLGKEFEVASSVGHIRDLPSRTADIPAAYKGKPWARMGVDVDNGFRPLYVVPADKKAQVKKLKALAQQASVLYLATDEDREGEAIAWHLIELLKPAIPVKRMVFHEITERAIHRALEDPREVDRRLVDAQEARRILDRLYGYEVSLMLWRKVRPRLSAGRVQSVATRLIVEREQRRKAFHSAEYCSLVATLLSPDVDTRVSEFLSELQELGGRRVANGRHFDPATGMLSDSARRDGVVRLEPAEAEALQRLLTDKRFTVAEVQKRPFTQRPHPPFITSTLQQEAARKLGFTAQRTMRVAQRLYEGGFITYMRTDSTTLSQEALTAARSQAAELYGKSYLPDTPRLYAKKVKGAQEAHEAIRPAGEVFRMPEALRRELDEEAQRLYELIWKRTIASQMRDAVGERSQARLVVTTPTDAICIEGQRIGGDAIFSASGKVITFAGYLRAYVEGADDPDAELEDKERLLPPLVVGDALSAKSVDMRRHNTLPPARYTEASLVKELEERGIGRPSTYATIIQTIQDRGYVWKQGGALVPTLTAFAVTNLLKQHFEELVDYEFTARMESDLDEISGGEKKATPWLEQFYFGKLGRPNVAEAARGGSKASGERRATLELAGLHGLIGNGVEQIDARDVCSLQVGVTPDGQALTARVGRYGPYLQVGDGERRVTIADDVLLDELDAQQALDLIREADLANRKLGEDPTSGKPVYLKSSSYGPYVQLGDPELTPKGAIKKGTRPKMASVWPSMDVRTVSLADALELLSYPKTLGHHPESGAAITVQDGRYGPYVQMELSNGKKESRSLQDHAQLETIDLDGALALLAQPRQTSRRPSASTLLATLADSPTTQKPIQIKDGRFGPYVTDGQVNATLPKGSDPQKVTFADALELIAAREQRLRDQGQDPRAPKKNRVRRKRPSGSSAKAKR